MENAHCQPYSLCKFVFCRILPMITDTTLPINTVFIDVTAKKQIMQLYMFLLFQVKQQIGDYICALFSEFWGTT